MRTALMVTTADAYGELQPEIDAWRADRERDIEGERWETKHLPTNLVDAYEFRDAIASMRPFDHCFLGAGRLPQLTAPLNLDGHGERPCLADPLLVTDDPAVVANRVPGTNECALSISPTAPYAAIGRLQYEGLAGIDAIAQYRAFYARRSRASAGLLQDYPPRFRLDDHFDFPGADQFGARVVSEMARDSSGLSRMVLPVIVGNDGDLAARVSALVYLYFSGGFQWQELDYIGRWDEFLASPPIAPIVGVWGSYMIDTMAEILNVGSHSIQRMLLAAADPAQAHALASIYDFAGLFRWSTFLSGGTVGQAGLDSYWTFSGTPVACVYGDPTVTMTQADQTLLNHEQRIAALETWRSSVGAGSPGGGSGSGSGKLVVNFAIYRPAGSTVRSGPGTANATAAVQRLQDSGLSYWVDPTITIAVGDPAGGIVKEVLVEWTDAAGATHSRIFGQLAQIVLA